jgi:small subunit ribosomal protein S3
MAKKVNPKIFRIPYIKEWQSKWFADKHKFKHFLKQDLEIRKFLEERFKNCGIAEINIERLVNVLRITIHTAKPGLIIGRGGVDIENLKKILTDKFLDDKLTLEVNVVEEKNPMLSADVVLESIIIDLEKRIPFRRVMKKAIKQVRNSRAKGVKVVLSGRLDGAEIARSEKLVWGNLPLQTLRADISYARGTAHTIYGSIGVKVWIYRGEKFQKRDANIPAYAGGQMHTNDTNK